MLMRKDYIGLTLCDYIVKIAFEEQLQNSPHQCGNQTLCTEAHYLAVLTLCLQKSARVGIVQLVIITLVNMTVKFQKCCRSGGALEEGAPLLL